MLWKEKQMEENKQIICVEDIHGKVYYTIDSIPEGTAFEYFNLSGTEFTELPEKVSTLKINKISVENCRNLDSLENLPKNVKEIYCSGANRIRYIPESIPNEAIKGMSNNDINKWKVNWMTENLAVLPKFHFTEFCPTCVHAR